MANQPDERTKRLRRFLLGALAITVVVLGATIFAIGIVSATFLTLGPCRQSPSPASFDLAYEDVTFPSGELTFEGYFIPASSDAVVIIAPPFSGDAGVQLPYAAMFHDLDLNVLSMTSRRCLGGPQTLGYLEGDDVVAAYTYLTTRDDVDPSRISAHGFSAAGAASLFAASREHSIRAVSAMGNYDDFHDDFGQTNLSDNPVVTLYKWGLTAGYQLTTGVRVEQLTPINVIDDIAPR
ncbi:MAG: hypothetical protein AAF125_10815, partial [Chloroflexota bacterium]